MVNNVLAITDRLTSTKLEDVLGGTFLSSLIVILLLIILAICINVSSKKALKNPLETPHGLFLIFMIFYKKMENLTIELMGENNRNFTPYIMTVSMYLFTSFIFGLTGLPSPVGNLAFPLILASATFVLIHATAIKYNKWRYFHRFIEPIPIMLPINIFTMWAPLISLTLRLFGNALAGYCIMTLIYFALTTLGTVITHVSYVGVWGPANFWVGSLITPAFHFYFDIFSGFIQTLVFIMLTMIFIKQEEPEDAEELVNQ